MKDRVGAADSSSSYVSTINHRLESLSSSPPKHTIFKIHQLLRRENPMAYEPEILAIGPYHRGKEHLQAMEVWKLRVLKSILVLHKKRDATNYVEAMKSLEGKARECYSESIFFGNGDEFAEMLLLDGCFIIQFLLSITGFHKHKHDTMINHCFFDVDWVHGSLCRDMLLLENQIPLFVLEELFALTKFSTDDTPFHVIAQVFAGTALVGFTSIPIPSAKKILSSFNDVEHLLGLLHRILCPPVINQLQAQDSRPSNSANDNGTRRLPTECSIKLLAVKLSLSCEMVSDDKAAVNEWSSHIIPSATKLRDSGVRLKIKEVEKENPFEVTFDNGVMEVPIFNICDSTETAYRNLIAYEQYFHENSNRCFAHHANFMDCLINTPEDVALLREYRIVTHLLGDDEAVSTMCNKLCRHITFSMNSHYKQIIEKVNSHCRKRRHRWMAKLRRDYFNNPWSFISFFAAVFLLVLTVTQTVFSAMGS